ncbi:membrane protein [Microbacteriaceae bacterium SG_E_30_P1]|uniref:Membrane protein n=1 Tax=Antiquaquibacter oligotrophicus TaxID=2880260 RepID=A0ABT6KNI4_9MICO|nr:YihY/virulence factor BrkB family protein [Antiquaquibacter oligotrophicus]MDH6180642.1 membrane protein [Antiquaquibacter oligotrophicus]UDF13629.1 YihY/virulence factor BrkB family protein [Antiquaquibacter oligotrophicus]
MSAEPPTTRGLPRRYWAFAARRAWHGFLRHRGIDSAASLSFFAALAFFPAALAIVSALAIGNGDRATTFLLSIFDEVARPETVDTIREPLEALLTIGNPGIALAIGLVLSLWSLASYGTAFGRAVNGAYEVQEGRQVWRFRGLMLVVAVFLLLMFTAIVALLLTTPRVSSAIGRTVGIGAPWTIAFDVVRWPLLVALVALVMAVLYYASPNVKHERIRWVSHGTLFAVTVWLLVTLAFALYVTTVAPYDRIYGWLGGGLALLLWLYVSNLVLVIGAEVDAEVMRIRQLSSGMASEESIQVALRDTKRNLMLARQRADDEAEGRAIREENS